MKTHQKSRGKWYIPVEFSDDFDRFLHKYHKSRGKSFCRRVDRREKPAILNISEADITAANITDPEGKER